MNSDVNFEDKKIGSKKCHGILFLEFAENQSVSTCTFAMYNATPNPGAESWVPSDCTAGLGYPHSTLMPKESVQTGRMYTGDGLKGAYSIWQESVYTMLLF